MNSGSALDLAHLREREPFQLSPGDAPADVGWLSYFPASAEMHLG